MTPSPATSVRLARLLHEVKVDLAALEARANELNDTGSSEGAALSRTASIVAAVNIHAWYTALETAFERVARLLDETIPSGHAWHVELISQMATDIPGIRPALVDEAIVLDLEELRKFRHFFRNAYVLNFDEARIRELAGQLLRAHPVLRERFQQLCAHIARVVEELAAR